MTSALSRAFPTPAYLTLPCVGVDISDTSLKYIALEPKKSHSSQREIRLHGDIKIPSGVVQSGQVADQQKLTAVLKEFKAKTRAEHVRVSLPEERAYLFETEIKANTPMKEVRGLLEFRLEENVPIPSRDVLFDFSIIKNKKTRNKVHVAVAAYPAETIHAYYNACVDAGLKPLSFEVEGQAMARAVIPKDTTGAVMLVDFGKTRTGIGIAYDGALLYTSTIDIGGNQLSAAMRKVLGDVVSESDLTKIKNTQGLNRGVESSDVRDALLSTLSVVRDEIATRMQYWHVRVGDTKDKKINSIILGGGSANLKGLPAYFTETLGVPSFRGNVWEHIYPEKNVVPPIDRPHSFGYVTAIGLALKNIV